MSNNAVYLHMPDRRPLRQTMRLIWLINGLAGFFLPMAVILMGARWLNNVRYGIPQPDVLIALLLVGVLIFFVRNIRSVCAAWVSSADLALDSRGVSVVLLQGTEHSASWAAIAQGGIREVKATSLLRPARRGETMHVVPAPTLSLIYRVAGLAYGAGFHPVFAITSDHERRDELLQRIEQGASQ